MANECRRNEMPQIISSQQVSLLLTNGRNSSFFSFAIIARRQKIIVERKFNHNLFALSFFWQSIFLLSYTELSTGRRKFHEGVKARAQWWWWWRQSVFGASACLFIMIFVRWKKKTFKKISLKNYFRRTLLNEWSLLSTNKWKTSYCWQIE